jgi:hypothetical protein
MNKDEVNSCLLAFLIYAVGLAIVTLTLGFYPMIGIVLMIAGAGALFNIKPGDE